MKATLFIHREKMEIQTAAGVKIGAKKGETKEAFLERAKAETEKQFMEELDVYNEVDAAKIKRKGSQALKKDYSGAQGLEREIIAAVLTARKQEVPDVPESKENAEAPTSTKKKAAKKTPKKSAPEMVKEAAEKAGAPKKKETKKEPKAKKPKATLESVIAAANKARENVGKEVTFQPYRDGKDVDGTIKAVWIDKRVPMALYRIQIIEGTGDKAVKVNKNKVITSDAIKFK